MIDFYWHDRSPVWDGLIIPASLTIRVTTDTERICLTGYCTSVSRVTAAISMAINQSGGTLTFSASEIHGINTHLVIDLQLQTLCRLEVIRGAIYRAGGIIETVQIDYQIRPPTLVEESDLPLELYNNWHQQLANPCIGCRYYHGLYYGENFLVCAIHPHGPEAAEYCRNRQD